MIHALLAAGGGGGGIPVPAFAVVNVAGFQDNFGSPPYLFSFNCPGEYRGLVIAVRRYELDIITGFNYADVPMSFAGQFNIDGSGFFMEYWRLSNPKQGVNNLEMFIGSGPSTPIDISAVAFEGAVQVTDDLTSAVVGFGGSESGDPTISVPVDPLHDIAMDAGNDAFDQPASTYIPGAGQTIAARSNGFFSSTEPAAGITPIVMNWTAPPNGTQWGHTGIAVRSVDSVIPPPPTPGPDVTFNQLVAQGAVNMSGNTATFGGSVSSGTNLGLVVAFTDDGGTGGPTYIQSVTWNDIPMRGLALAYGVDPVVRSYIYGLSRPPTGPGTCVVTYTVGVPLSLRYGIMAFNNVNAETGNMAGDQASSNGAAGGTTPTLAVPDTEPGEIAVDCLAAWQADPQATGGSTQQWEQVSSAVAWGAGATKPGAASLSMSWTIAPAGSWCLCAASIRRTYI